MYGAWGADNGGLDMLRFTSGICLTLTAVFAFYYGYSWSLTLDGFPIQGYIGAAYPAILVVAGACFGAVAQGSRT